MVSFVRREGVSLYFQVKEYLEDKIDSGEWKPGEQIPTEAELERLFQVSKATVRQAVSELVQRGRIVKRQGVGTFVTEPKIIVNLESAHLLGKTGEHRLIRISQAPASSSVSKWLGIGIGDSVYEVWRARLIGAETAMIQRSYLPAEMCPDLDKRDLTKPLYEFVRERLGIKTLRLETFVEPVIVSDDEAEVLGVERGSPALLVNRIAYSETNTPVMLSKSIVRGDRCRVLIGSLPQEI